MMRISFSDRRLCLIRILTPIIPTFNFSIEKTFHDFRQLVLAFKKASKEATEHVKKSSKGGRHPGWKGVPESTQNLIAFTDAFAHVIDSEPISTYMGKVSNFTLLF